MNQTENSLLRQKLVLTFPDIVHFGARKENVTKTRTSWQSSAERRAHFVATKTIPKIAQATNYRHNSIS